MSLVELISEKDLTGCQNIYDYVGKESYNVLKHRIKSNWTLAYMAFNNTCNKYFN